MLDRTREENIPADELVYTPRLLILKAAIAAAEQRRRAENKKFVREAAHMLSLDKE